MDSDTGETLEKGKREAVDAVEMEVVSAKKQKVDENVTEIKTDPVEDTYCSKPEQSIKVNVSAEDGHVVSVLEDKSNVLEENTSAAEKKPAVAAGEGSIAATSKKDESNDDSDSFFQNKTSMVEDVAASVRAPALLVEEDPAAPPKKEDESNKDYECCSKDETILDEDVTGANLSPPVPIIQKPLVSVQKKDDSWTDEFDSVHESKTDDNVATAKAAHTENGPLLACRKEGEPGHDNEKFAEVTAESIPLLSTKKENRSNGELELDHEIKEELESDYETSSSDDDPPNPVTPTEQTTGGKTLYVGNLSFSIEQEDVEDFFKAAGDVVAIRFGMNSNETFKGYGYVEFASAEAAEKALRELNGKELLRRRVRLDFAKERATFTPYTGQDAESSQKVCKDQGQKVFVRGFNKTDCQDEIRRSLEEHFGSCGEISRVDIPKDENGCPRGIAYIHFKEKDAFSRALALNGSEFREGTLSVLEAKSRCDSRDNGGVFQGYIRNDGRYRQEFNGRRGVREAGGGRSHWQDFGGRSNWQNSSGRGFCEGGGGGTSNWQSFSGRRGVCVSGGGRSGRQNFSGRRDGYEGGAGRSSWQDFGGRSDCQNFRGSRGVYVGGGGRSSWQDFGGRSDCQKFSGSRGVYVGGGGISSCREFIGRSDFQNFSGRRGVYEGGGGRSVGESGSWSGGGVWCGRGVGRNFSGRGFVGSFSGRSNDWSGGGSSSSQQTTPKFIAAPGKREGEDAIQMEMVSPKKQKVEGKVSEMKNDPVEVKEKVEADTLCSDTEQLIKVISPVDGHVMSVLEDDYNVLKEETSAAGKKIAVTAEEGHIIATSKKDESNDVSDSFIQDETRLREPDIDKMDKVALLTAKKENGNNEELELDHETKEELESDYETGTSDDDHQTPATPTHQTTGGKTLFVGNLSFSIEQEDVEHFFKPAGEVVNIRFGMNSDETFKGYGYVEFASAEAAEKWTVIKVSSNGPIDARLLRRGDRRDYMVVPWIVNALRELNGKELLRRRVKLDFLKERATFTPYTGQVAESSQKLCKDEGQTVFVRGFNKADSQDEIRRSLEEHFGSCGEISRLTVPKDEAGTRGVAYIHFKDKDGFNRALALNGSEFKEGTLLVIEARPRYDNRDNGGDFGGYGRNGGRYSWHDFSGRRGVGEGGNFSGRRGGFESAGRSDCVDFGGGRSNWQKLSGRRGGFEGGGDGRSGRHNFSGRRDGYEGGGGSWGGSGGVWRGRGVLGFFRGTSNGWSRGGGRQPSPNVIAAPRNNTSLINEDQMQ